MHQAACSYKSDNISTKSSTFKMIMPLLRHIAMELITGCKVSYGFF